MAFLPLLLVSLLLLPCCDAIAEDGSSASEQDFLALHQAYRRHDRPKLQRLAPQFKGGPLAVYADFYLLSHNLEHSDPAQVHAFLARSDDTPLIDQLRGEWLTYLGDEQRLDDFDRDRPGLVNENETLRCYTLQSRQRRDSKDALQKVRALWLNGQNSEDACEPLFKDAIDAGILTQQDIRDRLQLALEAGNVKLARELRPMLQGEWGFAASALKAASRDADRFLRQRKDAAPDAGQRTLMLFALHRLAQQSPNLALRHWQPLAEHFSTAEQHYFYGWLAYEAARKLEPRALGWYQQADTATLRPAQLEWRVRAALRAMNWREVERSVLAMSPPQRAEPEWQYWAGRALKARGDTAAARQWLAPLSGKPDFYGQLAAEELGDTPLMDEFATTQKPDEHALAVFARQPAVQRAVALYRMGLRREAYREWSWLVRDYDDAQLLLAAEFARRQEMYDRAIGAANLTRTSHDFNLRYLAPYREALQPHLAEHALNEAWVYGLMRQESRFASSARSQVGASGLMQIMPSTARWIARRIGMKGYRNSMLEDLDTNLKLGTYYMKTVMSWFDDSPVLASAAYNAGPSRARRWRGEVDLEGAIYAETIPFNETRDYVKKVMSNTVHYARKFEEPKQSLKQLMGVINAKSGANQKAIPDEK